MILLSILLDVFENLAADDQIILVIRIQNHIRYALRAKLGYVAVMFLGEPNGMR